MKGGKTRRVHGGAHVRDAHLRLRLVTVRIKNARGFRNPSSFSGGRFSSDKYQRNSATRQPAPRSLRCIQPCIQPFADAPICRAAPSRGADQENSHDGNGKGPNPTVGSDRPLREEADGTSKRQRPRPTRRPSRSDKERPSA